MHGAPGAASAAEHAPSGSAACTSCTGGTYQARNDAGTDAVCSARLVLADTSAAPGATTWLLTCGFAVTCGVVPPLPSPAPVPVHCPVGVLSYAF